MDIYHYVTTISEMKKEIGPFVALIVDVNIIFQEDYGCRYYVYGSKSEYLDQVKQNYQKSLPTNIRGKCRILELE